MTEAELDNLSELSFDDHLRSELTAMAIVDLRRLRNAISDFAKSQEWAGELWKSQPHIKPLFDIAKDLE